MANYELAVDWDNDGDWDDAEEVITSDLLAIECRRGRDYASQLTGRATAGRLIATLKNTSGKYSSFYSSSPIYGQNLPGRKVKFRTRPRVNIEGVTETPDATLDTINVEGVTETFDGGLTSYNVVGVTETYNGSYETINIIGMTEDYDYSYPVWYAEGVSEETSTQADFWTGFLSRIAPAGTVNGFPTVTLEANGPIERLNGKKVTPAKQASALTGTIIGAILDDADWPAGDRDLDAGQTTVGRWFVDEKEALTAIREIEETELGFFYELESGYLAFEDRHNRLKGDKLVSQATFSDASGATLTYRSIEQQDPLREIYNEVVATVAPYTASVTPEVLWTLQEQPELQPGEAVVFWAEYPNVSKDPTTGAYADSWETPAVGGDITQTGVANGDIGVSVAKSANTMKITITNNHATDVATLTLVQAQGTTVTKSEVARVSDSDATSQTNFGIRTYRLPGPWLPNTLTARDFARYIISRYKDPLPVLSMTFMATKSSDLMAEALARKISDRVTVVAEGAKTMLGINDDFFIESIGHRVTTAGKNHEVTFELSDASGDGDYWVVGTSALGVSTKLAY